MNVTVSHMTMSACLLHILLQKVHIKTLRHTHAQGKGIPRIVISIHPVVISSQATSAARGARSITTWHHQEPGRPQCAAHLTTSNHATKAADPEIRTTIGT